MKQTIYNSQPRQFSSRVIEMLTISVKSQLWLIARVTGVSFCAIGCAVMLDKIRVRNYQMSFRESQTFSPFPRVGCSGDLRKGHQMLVDHQVTSPNSVT